MSDPSPAHPSPHDPLSASASSADRVPTIGTTADSAPTHHDPATAHPDFAAAFSMPGDPAAGQSIAAPGYGPTSSPPRHRRISAATIVLGILLVVVVIAAGLGAWWLVSQLDTARSQITDQQRQIEEQRDLLDRKEQFGAAMSDLYDTVTPLTGLPYDTLVPWDRFAQLADQGWVYRRHADAMDRATVDVRALAQEMTALRDTANAQAASSTTGSAWEATLDRLGNGWVSMVFDDATAVCGREAMACVSGSDPFLVHVNDNTRDDPQMTDWIRTGVAYHEYAHVLQFTNPDPTAKALDAFDGDVETMADCYALTFLDGWSLDHEVPIDEFSYWQVNVGYGYTCDEGQRQVVRDWVADLGIVMQPVGG